MSSSPIATSQRANRTNNPIRKIVDNLTPNPNHPKKLLNLALGDPTVFGSHLQCPTVLRDAIVDIVMNNNSNGYLPSIGSSSARKAIAQYTMSSSLGGNGEGNLSEDDIIITSGCSGAVEMAITVLLNEGDNILVPCPGFPLYQVITESLGGNVKPYPLSDGDFSVDIAAMENLIDEKTKAILICNPSNPCGSSFTSEHLKDIAAVAKRHNLPVISDEIYAGVVFEGSFTPFYTVCGDVPVLTLGGLAKEFLVPGWRVGWVVINDHTGRFDNVRKGLKNLSQLIVGANSVVQAAIPRVLCPEPGSAQERALKDFKKDYFRILQNNAKICREMTLNSPYVSVSVPKGALYAMVKINFERLTGIRDDTDFAEKLLVEENLSVLPGQCFGVKGYIRLVICPPEDGMRESIERLLNFCQQHERTDIQVDEKK